MGIRSMMRRIISGMILAFTVILMMPGTQARAAEKLDIFEIKDNKGPYNDPDDDTHKDADYIFYMDGNEKDLTLNAVTQIFADIDADIKVTWTAIDIGDGAVSVTPAQNDKYATISPGKNALTRRKTFRVRADAKATIQVDEVDDNGEIIQVPVDYEDSRIIDIIQGVATASFLRVDFAPGSGPVFRDKFGGVTFTVSMQDINGEELSGPINWILSDTVDFVMDKSTNTLRLTPTGKMAGEELYTTVQASINGVSESKVFEILFQPDDETEEEITVTFNSNVTGANASVVPGFPSKIVVVGRKYGFLPKVERTGFTFIGWYTEALGGKKIDTTTRVPIGTPNQQTLYAHWIMDGQVPTLTKVNTAKGDFRVVGENYETANDGVFTLTAVRSGHGTAKLKKLAGPVSNRVVIAAAVRVSSSEFTVNAIAKNALAGKSTVRSLVIPSTVKSIGAGAFRNMKGLTLIEIDASSLKSVGKQAFSGIPAGTKVMISAATAKQYRKAVKLISKAGGSKFDFLYAD